MNALLDLNSFFWGTYWHPTSNARQGAMVFFIFIVPIALFIYLSTQEDVDPTLKWLLPTLTLLLSVGIAYLNMNRAVRSKNKEFKKSKGEREAESLSIYENTMELLGLHDPQPHNRPESIKKESLSRYSSGASTAIEPDL